MADRTNDERLRITADLGFRLHDDEVRAIAAELLAARARIARLEQEPPMALVDFGVGFNWKGLHEDMQRLRAERDAARAEVARLRSRVGWLDHLDTPEGRAMHATEAVRVENEHLRADLREAMELLRAHGQAPGWVTLLEAADWDRRYGELLAKHKETDQ